MTTTVIILSYLLTTILIIWFKSDAVIEYGKLLKLSKILKIDEFQKKKDEEDASLTYIRFLRITYDNFFIKLITCPYCLSFWLSLLFSINHIYFMPLIYINGLILYGIINLLYKQ